MWLLAFSVSDCFMVLSAALCLVVLFVLHELFQKQAELEKAEARIRELVHQAGAQPSVPPQQNGAAANAWGDEWSDARDKSFRSRREGRRTRQSHGDDAYSDTEAHAQSYSSRHPHDDRRFRRSDAPASEAEERIEFLEAQLARLMRQAEDMRGEMDGLRRGAPP
jgi:hypothetical protein